ncbi:MAG TPA: flagellar basal body rod C-terminal domain-containing protein [Crenalkalicoccus sp.]|nr:flagellar basal body rod C-terminal domain-containing protein [Crenalkalicoccus sp.]
MSLDLALGIAGSGLAAVQRGLAQASQNIANAQTPGYTRKAVPQAALTNQELPAGLRTGPAQREVDQALQAQLNGSRAAEAAATLRDTLLRQVEDAQGTVGDGTSLPDAFSGLNDAFVALRASPDDAGLQRAALDAATTTAERLNTLSQAIGGARQQAQDTVVSEVASANAALRQIASLTLEIRTGQGDNAAALEDQRDQALASLSRSLDVQAVKQPDGGLTVIARGGIVLPLDPDRDVLATQPASLSAGSYYGGGGTLPGVTLNGLDITKQITGGRLGEALALRDTTLPRFQAEADLAAATLAGRMDAVGLRLYTDSDGVSVPATGAYAGSAQMGFAGRIQVNPAVAASPALLRDGTQAVAATPGGPTAFTPNPSGGPAGFTTLLDRVLGNALGDVAAPGSPWPAIPTSGLGPDGSLASPFLAPATVAGYATRLTAAQSADRAAASAALDQASATRTALETRFTEASGVDTDKEMASLITLQNAYAANARVMTTVQAMWDTLLNAAQ